MQKTGISGIVYSIAALTVAALFLYMPDTVLSSVTSSLTLTSSRLIPSVFPYSVIASFFCECGGVEYTDRLFSRVNMRLFGSYYGASALISGLLFGFPLGAVTLSSLYRRGKIDRRTLERLLCSCCCASPAFTVIAVGKGLFGSVSVGLVIWCSQAAASVLCGILLNILSPSDTKIIHSVQSKKNPNNPPLYEMLSSSVANASRVMLSVCGSVTFFSLLASVTTNLISNISRSPYIPAVISAIFEFSSGCTYASVMYRDSVISFSSAAAIAGFAVGFSGLSVISQTSSSTPEQVSLSKFFICRIAIGLVTAASVYAFIVIFPVPADVAADTDMYFTESSPMPVISVIAVLSLVLIIQKKSSCKKQKNDL